MSINFQVNAAIGGVPSKWNFDCVLPNRIADDPSISDIGRKIWIAEENGSRSETRQQFEFSANVNYFCDWEDRNLVAAYLEETCYNPTSAEGQDTLSYFTHYYPAVVTQITLRPLGAEAKTVKIVERPNLKHIPLQAHTLAKLEVQYKGRALPSLLNFKQNVTPSVSMRQLPTWGYYWRSDGSPLLDQESVAQQETRLKIQRSISGIRQIPPWFFDLRGKVNVNPWVDWITIRAFEDNRPSIFMPGTLLYMPSSMDRQISTQKDADNQIWNLQFELSWNPIGWNNFQRPHGIDTIMRNVGTPPAVQGEQWYMYPPDDFGVLLPNKTWIGDYYIVRLEKYNGEIYSVHVSVVA